MADVSLQSGHIAWADTPSFYDKLNHQWHKLGLQVFMMIVLAHWAEHLAQAVQVYILHWPIPASRGVLGLWFPWLVKSELLHYLYALIMIIGLWIFRRGFQGLSYQWWMVAFWIQFWHHIEHALLQIAGYCWTQPVWLACAREYRATVDSPRGAASVLQHDRLHPYGAGHVLPYVPAEG